jgi:hypothetical protein
LALSSRVLLRRLMLKAEIKPGKKHFCLCYGRYFRGFRTSCARVTRRKRRNPSPDAAAIDNPTTQDNC